MSNPILQSSFRYLDVIVEALNRFYQNDYELLCDSRRTHEQTVSFCVAKYLADQLENLNNNMRVDCEYHGDVSDPCQRKMIGDKRIRPDIIYHDRYECNAFCIEMKIRSKSQSDSDKVNGLIKYYGYQEGFCICNIGKHFVTIHAVSKQQPEKWVMCRLRYDSTSRTLERLDEK